METETPLVRANGAVKLYAVSLVYLYCAFIIHPRYTERNDTFRLGQSFQQTAFAKFFFMGIDYQCQGIQHFFYRLMKFRFTGIFGNYAFHYF